MAGKAKAAQNAQDELWATEWTEGAGEATIKRRAQAKSDTLLFCSWFCPFAQRAWIALEEKGVDYKYVEINPYEVDVTEPGGYTKRPLPLETKREQFPDFIAASPRGLVPALDNAGERVWESVPLVEFIDERFDGPPLMPVEPLQRARVRIWTDHCTSRVQSAYYTLLLEQTQEGQTKARETFFAECRALANAMSPEGPFFLGAAFSLVDIALAPFWQRFVWVGGHYRGLQFPKDDPAFQRLGVWWDAVQVRPSVAATLVCRERLVSSYSQYSRNVGNSDFAKGLQGRLSKEAQARLK